MALIVLTSAHGSPGVTTTALGLGLVWPRPVLLVEADPTGASGVYAGYYRGSQEPTGGLINLAVACRAAPVGEALAQAVVQLPETCVQFLPGPRAHGQSPSLIPLWEPLAEALRALDATGQDVIVDAGRLGLAGSATPLIHGADLTLLLTRSSLPALAGARSWAATLSEAFTHAGGENRLATLLIDEHDRWPRPAHHPRARVQPYTERQVTRALRLPVLTTLPWDAEVAEVYSHGATPPRKFSTSGLVRAYRATASVIQTAVARHQASLAIHSLEGRADVAIDTTFDIASDSAPDSAPGGSSGDTRTDARLPRHPAKLHSTDASRRPSRELA